MGGVVQEGSGQLSDSKTLAACCQCIQRPESSVNFKPTIVRLGEIYLGRL